MPKNSTIRNLVLGLLLVMLLAGVINLFLLRFRTGDIYPAYSSLRSDPLGTRMLYDSLDNFDAITVKRNYLMLPSLTIEPDATFFYFGSKIPRDDKIPKRSSRILDRLNQSGGRLVISYLPVQKDFENTPYPEEKIDSADPPELKAENDIEEREQVPVEESNDIRPADSGDLKEPDLKAEPPGKGFVSIKEHWGFEFAYSENLPVNETDKKSLALEAKSQRPDLPAAISWHTNLYFKLIDDSWQTLYSVDEKSVIIERPMGKGSIVLCADSYFISNEALRSERHPQLLVWLLGGHSNIIFDESHFGIYKQPGVAALLRHFNFQWFFGALALVALLFLWKSAVYFVPPPKDDTAGGTDLISEKDYTQGLIALLRRNIEIRNILQVCGTEWEQTFKHDKRLKSGAVAHIKNMLQTDPESLKRKSNPVAGYRKICQAFKRLGIYIR